MERSINLSVCVVSPAGGNFALFLPTNQPTALLARTVVIFIKPLTFLMTLPLAGALAVPNQKHWAIFSRRDFRQH